MVECEVSLGSSSFSLVDFVQNDLVPFLTGQFVSPQSSLLFRHTDLYVREWSCSKGN